MDTSRAQRQDLSQPPRNLYFGAEDLKTTGPDGTADKMLPHHRARRFKLSEHVIEQANNLANSVRTLRPFDKTGNAGLALDHIEDTMADLQKLTRNLVTDVEEAEERWQQTNTVYPHPTDVPEPSPTTPARITPLVMANAVESSVKAALDHVERQERRHAGA